MTFEENLQTVTNEEADYLEYITPKVIKNVSKDAISNLN